MHLVSCRHSTSGRIDLRNLATRSMRSRTELMFHVVREKCMASMYQGETGKARAPPDEAGDMSAAVGWAKPTGRANARPMTGSACPPFKIAIASRAGTAQGAPLPTTIRSHAPQDEAGARGSRQF